MLILQLDVNAGIDHVSSMRIFEIIGLATASTVEYQCQSFPNRHYSSHPELAPVGFGFKTPFPFSCGELTSA